MIQQLRDADEVRFADNGGLVSPSGLAYIGSSQHRLGNKAAACAVKRVHLDVRVARAAQRAGARLLEGFEVGAGVRFDPGEGMWAVQAEDGRAVRGRVLVCADGAPSRLARRLGMCHEEPLGISSRAYIAGGSHNATFDGAGAAYKHAFDPILFGLLQSLRAVPASGAASVRR